MIQCSCGFLQILSTEFAACSKPPSRNNHRKASYPRTQQRDHLNLWELNPDHSIMVVVKTTPLPIRPRCRQTVAMRMIFRGEGKSFYPPSKNTAQKRLQFAYQ